MVLGERVKLYELKSYIKLWVTDESNGALHLGAWMLWAGRRRRPQWTCPSSRSAWACGTWSATCTRRPSTWSMRTGRTGCGPWRTGRTSSRRRWAAPSASPFHSPPGKPVLRGDAAWHLALSDQSSGRTGLACRSQALQSGGGCHFCQCQRELLSSRPWQRTVCHCLLSLCFTLVIHCTLLASCYLRQNRLFRCLSECTSSSSWELPQEHRSTEAAQERVTRQSTRPLPGHSDPTAFFCSYWVSVYGFISWKFCQKSGSAVIYRQNSSRTTWEGPDARTSCPRVSARAPKLNYRSGHQASGPHSILFVTQVLLLVLRLSDLSFLNDWEAHHQPGFPFLKPLCISGVSRPDVSDGGFSALAGDDQPRAPVCGPAAHLQQRRPLCRGRWQRGGGVLEVHSEFPVWVAG